jgi:phage/plasmid primase-like uncharacterized protein
VRGSGIGLSVVHHVIHAHRGTIQVDSRAGEGTTVTVVLPSGDDLPAVSRSASLSPPTVPGVQAGERLGPRS